MRAGGSPSAVPGVDRVTSNLKTWLRGTHHGVGADHLDAYLDEFVFRFNRRYYPMAGFATLLGLGAVQAPTTGDQILSPLTPDRTTRRRGRATGQTGVRFPNPPLVEPEVADLAVTSNAPKRSNAGRGHRKGTPLISTEQGDHA